MAVLTSQWVSLKTVLKKFKQKKPVQNWNEINKWTVV